MALTVAQLTTALTSYNACLLAISLGQSYEINGRQMTRANLREVRDTIDWLEKKIDVASDTSGGFDLASIGRQS
jgi:hypothetical protein